MPRPNSGPPSLSAVTFRVRRRADVGMGSHNRPFAGSAPLMTFTSSGGWEGAVVRLHRLLGPSQPTMLSPLRAGLGLRPLSAGTRIQNRRCLPPTAILR